jgi:hypothetical protein
MKLAYLVFAALAVLGGCSSYAPQYWGEDTPFAQRAAAELPTRVELTDVPFVPQDDWYCGPAALSMVLQYGGAEASFAQVSPKLLLPARQGSLQLEMMAATRTFGRVPHVIEPTLQGLLRELAAGRPVIALENFGTSWYPLWHYSVVVGYDLEKQEVYRRSGLRQRVAVPMPIFEHVWMEEGYWAMVALAPDDTPTKPQAKAWREQLALTEPFLSAAAAGNAWRNYLATFPEDAIGLAGLGNSQHAQGNWNAAAESYRLALSQEPSNANLARLAQQVFTKAQATDDAACAAKVSQRGQRWPCPTP